MKFPVSVSGLLDEKFKFIDSDALLQLLGWTKMDLSRSRLAVRRQREVSWLMSE